MLKINMFSRAETVKGQGVGSAYRELIDMLKKIFTEDFQISINQYSPSDISHYHTVNPEFYLSTFLRRKRGVLVGYVHFLPETLEGSIKLSKPIFKLFASYLISFYRRMDHLVVVNPMFGEELAENYGISPNKITYIPNFVSHESFYQQSPETIRKNRETYGIDSDKFMVLGVGQIQKRKGVDDFIKLSQRHPDVEFVWVGGFSFGKITDGYENYREIYENPPANLHFTGIVDRSIMVDYYNMADVFLLPSYSELFPMSILEAFSCGTAVMVRDLDLYRVIIDNYYLPCQNVDEMGQAIEQFVNNPDSLLPHQEKSLMAAAYYSEKNVAELWKKFYTEIVKK